MQADQTVVADEESLMSQAEEEEKQSGKIEKLETVVKEHISKSKLMELVSKTVDQLITQATQEKPEHFYLFLDSSLFVSLSKGL